METQVKTQKKKIHYAWFVLFGMILIMTGTMGTVSSCMGVFTPSVAEDLQVPVAAVAVYFSVRTISMAVLQPVAAWAFKKFDVRITITFAVLCANGGMMFLSQLHTIWGWYVIAFINGIGLAFICYMMVPVILANWFVTHLSTAIGIATAFTGIGGAVFSPLCGVWIASYGFRMSYILVGGVGMVLSLIGSILLLRGYPTDKGLLPYGAEKLEKKGKPVENEDGLTVKEMLKVPQFFMIYLIVIFIFFGTAFMQDVTNMAVSKGFDIVHAATVSTIMMIGIVVGKIVLGIINDHIGTKTSIVTGAALGIVAFAFLVQGGSAPLFVFIGAFLFGCCVGSMSTTPPFAVRKAFGNKQYAKIYSYAATCGVLTSTIGHPVYAAVYDKFGNYNPVMVACAIALVLVIVLTFLSVDQCNARWDGTNKKYRPIKIDDK